MNMVCGTPLIRPSRRNADLDHLISYFHGASPSVDVSWSCASNSGQIQPAKNAALSLSQIAIDARLSKLRHLTKTGGLCFVFGMLFPSPP